MLRQNVVQAAPFRGSGTEEDTVSTADQASRREGASDLAGLEGEFWTFCFPIAWGTRAGNRSRAADCTGCVQMWRARWDARNSILVLDR